jgi:hypothetical protein
MVLLALAVFAASMIAASGSGAASVTCAPGIAPPPSAITDYESGVTTAGATFHGKVDPHGCMTTYDFEYGTTTAYGNVTSPMLAGSGTSSVLASAAITGLAPHTVYHFRIVANSAAGTTAGRDLSFRTKLACVPGGGARPPSVVTDDATAVLATSATAHGKVDPHGCPTTYQVEYGPTTAYGNVTPAAAAGSGTQSVPAVAVISGLAPGTVYHYRVIAVSGAGTTAGNDELVETLGVPSVVEIAAHRARVSRGFVARIRLRCEHGSLPCHGSLTILLRHHVIGRGGYLLVANSPGVVSVRLNRRGRLAMRSQRRRRVELIAVSMSNNTQALLQLVRSFRPRRTASARPSTSALARRSPAARSSTRSEAAP